MGAKPQSDWTEHTAPDGRKYFFNSKTKQSSWEKPEELMSQDEKLSSRSVVLVLVLIPTSFARSRLSAIVQSGLPGGRRHEGLGNYWAIQVAVSFSYAYALCCCICFVLPHVV